MSVVASVRPAHLSPPSTTTKRPLAAVATTLEVLLVYSGILLYIWRWQASHPRVWMLLLTAVLASNVAHRDTLRSLGLSLAELRSNAQFVLPVIAALYIGLTALGFARHSLVLLAPGRQAIVLFVVVVIGVVIVRRTVMGGVTGTTSLAVPGLAELNGPRRVWAMLSTGGRVAQLLLWPTRQVPDYGPSSLPTGVDRTITASATLALIVLGVAWALQRALRSNRPDSRPLVGDRNWGR